MKLKCVKCGKIVSSEIPDDTKVSAWIECRECTNKDVFANKVKFDKFTLNGIKLKATRFYALCGHAELNFDDVDAIFKKARAIVEKGHFSIKQYQELLTAEEQEEKLNDTIL